jgi:uncharacterized Zn finger protein (UPF0148 family)
MNCPKCNAPLNEGDKFCQTCGSVINQVAPQPEQQPQVVENNMQQPMANMAPPVNNVQQVAPVGNIPTEPKKNNTIVYVLLGVIAVLLAGVIFLAVSSGSDDKEKEDKKDDKTEVKEEEKKDEDEVIASNYTKSNVNEYTFELPKGYSAGFYSENVVFYDDDMIDVEGYVSSMNMAYSNIDKELTKANFTSMGITNVSYTEKKVNNKNLLVFSGEYQGYKMEIIYVEYSYTKLVGAEVYYKSSANVNSDVYDILGRVVVDDSAFSSNTSIRVPGLQTTPATN